MLQRRSFFKSVALSFLLTSLTFFGLHAEVLAAQLTLSWTDNSTSEGGFNIERRTGSSTTFTLPDLRQRFVLGVAASGTGSTLGGVGGGIDHTHTGPSHTHT
ncbi:MAG: hypothetical protein HYS66_08675, partial [Deltaproteobacteria bacterium]|nr:hypothetical protein [Deltaproteobacteria bacterium]